jgi:hypothetical protein
MLRSRNNSTAAAPAVADCRERRRVPSLEVRRLDQPCDVSIQGSSRIASLARETAWPDVANGPGPYPFACPHQTALDLARSQLSQGDAPEPNRFIGPLA